MFFILQIYTVIKFSLSYNNLLFGEVKMLSRNSIQFTNNASGNLNKMQQGSKYKLIDIDDLHVQMLSPQFLQNKTLKKPLSQHQTSLAKTISTLYEPPQKDYNHSLGKEYPETVIFKKDEVKNEKKAAPSFTYLGFTDLSIKPAFKKTEPIQFQLTGALQLAKDKNNIFSALMKKGLKAQIAIKPQKLVPKQTTSIGPAEAKLKQMIRRTTTASAEKIKPQQRQKAIKKSQNSQVSEEINEQFDDYGNESFQKLSGAYESAIKQSIIGESIIRQSSAGDSYVIKESIRQSIRESVASSSGKIKQSIRQDIKQSIQHSSSQSMRDQIGQEISASQRKSRESIQQVYEQVFEEQSANSFSKSQNRFKKSRIQGQSLSHSLSASKSFRMKTNIIKTLKYAEQLAKMGKNQVQIKEDPALLKEKDNLNRIRENVSRLLAKKPATGGPVKNRQLYLQFKIQINKMLCGDQFQSKLQKLLSFISIGQEILPNQKYADELEDNVLKSVLVQLQNFKTGKAHLDEASRIRKQYEVKLSEELLKQEVNLRAEMDKKLSEQGLQLKKMIAELQSRMGSRPYSNTPMRQQNGGQYQIQSDYSIDSDNISWKADLWQLLPEYEKKKLYERQTAEVTQFLASIMVNQLKEQALQRSLDISFEFPSEYDQFQQSSRQNKPQSYDNKFAKRDEKKDKADFLSQLPKLSVRRPQNQQNSGEELQVRFETIKRDESVKAEIVKILSQYKAVYLRKKQEVIRNVTKLLTSRDPKLMNSLYSALQQVTILTEREIKEPHLPYVRAYEEQIIFSLAGIHTRSLNMKPSLIIDEMTKMYDRLVVVAQIATAEKCVQKVALDAEKDSDFNVQALTKEALRKMQTVPCPIDIPPSQAYLQIKFKREERHIKEELVSSIVAMLSAQLAKEFPKRKK